VQKEARDWQASLSYARSAVSSPLSERDTAPVAPVRAPGFSFLATGSHRRALAAVDPGRNLAGAPPDRTLTEPHWLRKVGIVVAAPDVHPLVDGRSGQTGSLLDLSPSENDAVHYHALCWRAESLCFRKWLRQKGSRETYERLPYTCPALLLEQRCRATQVAAGSPEHE
jgi:hypothetical protein